MSPGEHERLSEILLEAVELAPDRREAFLQQACEGNRQLFQKATSLLRHHDDAPAFLKTDALGPTRLSGATTGPEQIGPYKILRTLGEGGMGVVYLAEQTRPIRRQVAIKLLRLGLGSDQLLARFESECQALALMNHPNIARIVDVGTVQGQPYFVMELVDGEPITLYCDRRALTIEQRLELFVEVCNGIQHAHQKAIIHRDIKPSNVLVTSISGRAVPKIIDFGVAKAVNQRLTDRTLQTELGQLVGTPSHMSPEQAGSDPHNVDTRSDVYSLGVLLYELLSGALPFDTASLRGASLQSMQRAVLEDVPCRPSNRINVTGRSNGGVASSRRIGAGSLARRLAGDLDWITMKALEKDPARRYASPSDLAADIRRHLAREPVLARSPSTAYRLTRLLAKHRIGTAFAAVTTALLIILAATMSIQAARVSNERDRVRHEAEALRQALDFMSELAQLDPEVVPHGLERIEARPGDHPKLRARLMARLVQADPLPGLLLETALEQLRSELGPHHPETISYMHWLGSRLNHQWQFDQAESLLREVIDVRTRLYGFENPETLDSRVELGRALQRQGKLEKAHAMLREAARELSRQLGPDHPYVLHAINYLASCEFHRGAHDEGTRLLSEALPRMQRLLGRASFDTKMAQFNLGWGVANQGDLAGGLRHLREAMEWGFEYADTGPDGELRKGSEAIRAEDSLHPLQGDPQFDAAFGRDGYMVHFEQARMAHNRIDRLGVVTHLAAAVERGYTNRAAAAHLFSYWSGDPVYDDILDRMAATERVSPSRRD